jgi:hypothetical protein
VNAGIDTYIPLLQGQVMQVIAEDGNLKAANLQFNRYSVDLHAGKTFDALLTNPVAGYIPVYDRRLYMSNASQAPGGMLAYLEVPDATQHQLTVATAGGTGKGRAVAESMPGGINCDSSILPPAPGATNCTQVYNVGTELKLVSYANPGSLHTGWAVGRGRSATLSALPMVLHCNHECPKTVTATFAAQTAVRLITPNGGEAIPAGSQYLIKWGAPAKAVTFRLRYSLDHGVTWILIKNGITGNSFTWNVPTPGKNRKAALIQVTGYNAAGKSVGSDRSNASFNIETLAIVSPAGGESWTSGVNNLHDIVWQAFATQGLVKTIVIQYTKNNGTSWLPVATLDNSSGVYDSGGTLHWQIEPQVTGNKPNSKVRITLKDAAGNVIARAVSKKFIITQ